MEAKRTARAVANGRRAHHKCSVDGCPCRIDFSFEDASLILSRGSATSISFFFIAHDFIPFDRKISAKDAAKILSDGDGYVDDNFSLQKGGNFIIDADGAEVGRAIEGRLEIDDAGAVAIDEYDGENESVGGVEGGADFVFCDGDGIGVGAAPFDFDKAQAAVGGGGLDIVAELFGADIDGAIAEASFEGDDGVHGDGLDGAAIDGRLEGINLV